MVREVNTREGAGAEVLVTVGCITSLLVGLLCVR